MEEKESEDCVLVKKKVNILEVGMVFHLLVVANIELAGLLQLVSERYRFCRLP